jgi:hypothetical protein
MVLDGEDYAMRLAMVREYLSIVAVKDASRAPIRPGASRRSCPGSPRWGAA